MKAFFLVLLFTGCTASNVGEGLGPIMVIQSGADVASLTLTPTGGGEVLPCKKLGGEPVVYSCAKPPKKSLLGDSSLIDIVGNVANLILNTLL